MAKILLVEDDNNLREIYGERLMAEGYDIVSASDGEEALQTAVNEKPDLIISDVMMPKISGFDMLDILRQTPETKNVKIIMMTALSQAEDKTRADKLGADKYLVKSQVTLEDVARVVHDLLGDGDAIDAPVEDASAAAPQSIADTQVTDVPVASAPLPEPVIAPQPVAPVVSPPVAAPEPVVAIPAPEPIAPSVVTPPAPEPVAAQPPAPVAAPTIPTPAPLSDPAAPVVNPISGASDMPAAPVAAGTVQAQDSQTELNEVAAQIQQFAADTTTPEVQHEEPVQEPTAQDMLHAQNAAEEPTIVPAAPVAPTVNPTIPPVTPINTSNPEPASSRKKVIQPVSGDSLSTPDIHALYEQEMAKEAATAPVVNPESGVVAASPIDDGIQNPITTAAPMDAVPPPLETVDVNQISGIMTGEEEAAAPISPISDPAAMPPAVPAPEAPTSTDPSDPNNIAL
jgi:CheY-like chemotaxis protein